MSIEVNKRISLEYFEAFVKGDKEWWAKHVAPKFRRHDPGLPYEVIGPKGLQHHHDVLLTGVPDLKLHIHTVIAENDKVLVCLRFRGTHTGELFGYNPTGNAIDVEVFDLFQLHSGVIVEHWAMVDSLGILKALGAQTLK